MVGRSRISASMPDRPPEKILSAVSWIRPFSIGSNILLFQNKKDRMQTSNAASCLFKSLTDILDVVLFDILEISVGVHLELSYSKFVSYDDAVRVCLKS